MTYEDNNDSTRISAQEELELLAEAIHKDRVEKEHVKAQERNSFSSSAYGRRLVRGSIPLEGTDLQFSRISILAELIQETAYPAQKRATYLSLLQRVLTTLDEALQIKPPPGVKRYGPASTRGCEVLAVVLITTLVDYAAASRSNTWAPLAELIERFTARMREQYLDAYCYVLNPSLYSKVEKRWQRKHQTGSNRRNNIILGQSTMLMADAGVPRDQRKTADSKLIVRQLRRELTQLDDGGDEVQTLQLAARTIIDKAIAELDILEKVKPVFLPHQRKYDVWRVKPTDALIDEWHNSVLPDLTKNRMVKLPMAEPPIPWVYDKAPGRDNISGGYHRPSMRVLNPLVRQRGGKSKTIPSKSAVDLANTLGATGYTLDADQVAAFEWAIDRGYQEELGIPTPPEKTTQDLDRDTELNKISIQEKGYITDSKGRPLIKGTPEHNQWKAQRKADYDTAIEKQAKYLRTVRMRAGLDALKDQGALHWSWSFDGRLRVYPQQAASIHPQGSAIERSMLKFQQGEYIEEGSEAHDEVLQAIGASWKGDKCSHGDRKKHGLEAIKRFSFNAAAMEGITLDDPADISTLVKANADDPWALLQQLREYHRVFEHGQQWHVPIGIDASQSGLQLLSAMLRDPAGMEATNLTLPDSYQETDGPTDGYRKVADEALKLIDKMGFCAASVTNITKLLSGSNTRTLAKRLVLPLPYGSTIDGSEAAIRKAIAEDLGIKDLPEYVDASEFACDLAGSPHAAHYADIPATGFTSWLLSEKVIRDLTKLLRAAAARVYPAAMSALVWLEKLALKSINRQILEKNYTRPQLHWSLHDGSEIWFNRMKLKTRQVPTLSCGDVRIVSGEDMAKPWKTKMRQWMAPSVVHSLDGLLLREAFKDWGNGEPLMAIHDCVSCLPSALPKVRRLLKNAFIKICEKNSLAKIAKEMRVDMKGVKLITGDADLQKIKDSVFMFH